MKKISGFSKLSKPEKIAWLAKHFFTQNPVDIVREFASFAHSSVESQKLFDGISENTLTNFYLPYGVAPNFQIEGKVYVVPMVIEESSVVAAAASSAKYWSERGGFHYEVVDTVKVGQVHFQWHGHEFKKLQTFFEGIRPKLLTGVEHLTENMKKRGGGIKEIKLEDCTHIESGFYQIKVDFRTCNAMGANFINSVLEEFSKILQEEAGQYKLFTGREKEIEVIMAILSNYTPECLVKAWVECPVEQLGSFDDGITTTAKSGSESGTGTRTAGSFAERFVKAIKIAGADRYRATTHNKGIFNGIDAVVLATGNDFRATEACGHAYACRDGEYRSLSKASIKNGKFRFELEIPLALGTVGGLTNVHPLARRSLEMLGNPSAEELMGIVASVGLAQNFAAVKSLVTVGIQAGHMRMHLTNILNQVGATETEVEKALVYFADRAISFSSVRDFISQTRARVLPAK